VTENGYEIYWWEVRWKETTGKTKGNNIKMDLREIRWDGVVWCGFA
jgi:hypothetical protein